MKQLSYFLILSVFFLSLNGQVNRPLGVNLSYVADYATQLTFVNTFRQSRKWISCNADNTGPWDTQVSIPLRPDGYPIQIPYDNGVNPPQKLKSLVVWDLFGATPIGLYRLKSSGTGIIRLSNGASGIFHSPVDTLVAVNNGVIITIDSSLVSDPIRDIQFILPDYVQTYTSQTFTPELLAFVQDFQVLRFMDFTRTNGSEVINWSDRTSPQYYSQAHQNGVAWEYVAQLANETLKDIWINIPHEANDAYIDSLAHLLQNTLNTELKVYVEFSNEVWNSGFSQHADCAMMAQNLGYTGQQWERAWKFTAKRSADVFKIFESVFTNDARLVKIIPSQAANSWLSNQLVTFFNDPVYNPNAVAADAIAIGPYFGNEIADRIISNGNAALVTIPDIIDSLDQSQAEAFQWILDNKTVATNHSLQLIAYEGGQHLVGTGNNINDTILTPKLIAANQDSAMERLYCQYFNFWYQQVGNLFCHFSAVSKSSKYGSWGVQQNHLDTLNPKYLGLQNCVMSFNQSPTSVLSILKSELSEVYPNPSRGWVSFPLQPGSMMPYQVYNAQGGLMKSGNGEGVDISDLQVGVYLVKTPIKTFTVMRSE